MKKIATKIVIMVLSLIVGYIIGFAMVHIAKGSITGSSPMNLGLFILIEIAIFFFVTFISIILHEAGHLIGGLLSGYKTQSFRILSLTIQKDSDGWHLKRYNIKGTAGQCLMVPPHDGTYPYLIYNAGGVAMNLILCIISALMLFYGTPTHFGSSVWISLLIINAWLFLINALPFAPTGVPNDGKNIIELYRHPEQRKLFFIALNTAAEMSLGKRLCEMPEEWFITDPVSEKSSVFEISARSLTYGRLMDEMRFDEALLIAEEIRSQAEAIPELIEVETTCDLLLLEMLTQNRMEVIDKLWNKKFRSINMTTKKYITANCRYFPLKSAILFAHEYIDHQAPEKAQPYYDKVVSNQNNYAQPGEARTAIAIMDYIISNNKKETNVI